VCYVTGVVATSELTLPSGRPNVHACSAAFSALQPLHAGGLVCSVALSALLVTMAVMVLSLPCERDAAAMQARCRRIPAHSQGEMSLVPVVVD
jgi:hypothetical protein